MRHLLKILILVGLVSCKSTYRLTEQEIIFNPYHVGDTLVFKSNTGDRDTIFIIGVDRRKNPTDQLAIFPNYAEHLSVFVKHSDPASPGGGQRYLRSNFLEIHKWSKISATIDFDFVAKDAWFYGGNGISIIEIKNKTMTELKINSIVFRDVVIIHSNNTEYRHRNNFIDKIYWSNKTGYLKFDLLNGVTWELEKKYGR
jgi:hypothetical protein